MTWWRFFLLVTTLPGPLFLIEGLFVIHLNTSYNQFAQQYWSENLTMYFKMITDLQPIGENEAVPVLISKSFSVQQTFFGGQITLI